MVILDSPVLRSAALLFLSFPGAGLHAPSATDESPVAPPEQAAPEPRALAVSPTGELVAVAYRDGSVTLLDGESGDELGRLTRGLEEDPWALAFSPDGTRLAGIGHHGALRLWQLGAEQPLDDVEATELLRGIPSIERAHEFSFGALITWAPRGDRVLVSYSSGHASLWATDGECVTRWNGSRRRTDRTVAWHGDRWLVAEGNSVEFRDGRTGARPGEGADSRALDCGDPVVTLAVHPTQNLMATGHADYVLKLWDLDSGALVARSRHPDPWLTEEDDEVACIAWSPTADRIALSIREGSHVFVVDAADLSPIWTSAYIGGHFGEALLVCWSPDGRRVWSAFECGNAGVLWADPLGGGEVSYRADTRLPVFGGPVGVTISEADVLQLPRDGTLPW